VVRQADSTAVPLPGRAHMRTADGREDQQVQRSIPPDQARDRSTPLQGAAEHCESIGDLHFAADHFTGAVEQYTVALQRLDRGAVEDRVRILRKLAEAEFARSRFETAVAVLGD